MWQHHRSWITYIIMLICVIGTAQNECADDTFFQHLLSYDFEKTNHYLQSVENDSCHDSYAVLTQLMYHYGIDREKDAASIKDLTYQTPLDSIALCYFQLYYENRNETPLKQIEQQYLRAKKHENRNHMKLILLAYLEIYARSSALPYDQFEHYLNLYNGLSSTENEKAWGLFYENYYHGTSIRNDTRSYKRSAIKLKNFYHKNKAFLGKGIKIKMEESIGVYFRVAQIPDSSIFYLNKVVNYANAPYIRRQKLNTFLDFAALQRDNNDFERAAQYFFLAKNYIQGVDSLESEAVWKKFKSEYFYEPQKIYDSAYFYLKSSDSLKIKLNHAKNVRGITEINTIVRAAENEAELEISRQKEKTNRYVAIGLALGVLVVSLLAFFIYKNTKRKQRIAEQEKELEIQKKEKILKEQELNAIDAMIEGQEKERQRLASDLHDSVGATLSAARLQFDHLSNNKDNLDELDELFDKTKTLLNDAYAEVRSMAHLKNSGVIAKKGLLPAVEKLARNASVANGLTIEVQDFGLNEKLEGSLEISIFRIIQELVTNIIKHAQATEANISITRHEDSLSIIIEDNGKGFNIRKKNKRSGMGLSSIEKRIEHMEGSMDVDSTPGKGTNILIDLPL
ncbi:MAG: sensor histidine kinase [Bacteroidota bacterium]